VQVRLLCASVLLRDDVVPLRKQLKDKSKVARASQTKQQAKASRQEFVEGWELTVGIEIHAQLNTARKLFSGTT
jgi:aspartyl-tRNA(Asn)/glutamyl-tRNA(Gln) amidotransferase subunit B